MIAAIADRWFTFRHGWWWWNVSRRFERDRIARRIAWLLPRRIALWAFIRVYAASHREAPGPEYIRAHNEWQKGAGR